MMAFAQAYKDRSLAKLILTMEKYPKELKEDPVTKFHLDNLYEKLLENNLSRLIEPFSQVCVSMSLSADLCADSLREAHPICPQPH